MQTLESLGTEQGRKIYRNHGAGENTFGVSFSDLGKLKNKIKKNHAIALQLWNTGNMEARILACWAVDATALTRADLDRWVAEIDDPTLTDYFAAVTLQTPYALACMKQWMESPQDFVAQLGWSLLIQMAADSSHPDSFFEPYLARIEKEIHSERNRVRYKMNAALIAIGGRGDRLMKSSLAAAAKIGKVEVDHGVTGCKTPDAATYIKKIVEKRKAKSARAS